MMYRFSKVCASLVATAGLAGCSDPVVSCTQRLEFDVLRFIDALSFDRDEEADGIRREIAGALSRCSQLPLDSVFSDATLRDQDGKALTLLDLAVISDDSGLVSSYLAEGIPVEGYTFTPLHAYSGGTSLHLAARAESLSAASVLLDFGADPSAIDAFGQTPLMVSTGYSDDWLTLTQLLIDSGAQIDQQDFEGRSALSLAVWRGDVAQVRLLLANGASATTLADGTTLTELALERGEPEIAQILSEHFE